ncbi:MAG: glycosyltransferase family 2 protein [Candidatus Levybacteria bacterium]|nr:glycosyltransferase family 2 protein [Candidatus Levybacteria bacterium]
MEKSISIVIPTLNEESNIRRCLDSIFRQKFKGKLEVFLADGGSTDLTVKIARSYKVRILNNPLRNAESGKMIGLCASSSEYFMILDADMDLCGTDWFDKMLKPLLESPNVSGSFTKFVTKKGDSLLSRYITIDPIQRDPLFRFLTSDPEQVAESKRRGYWICRYDFKKIVPAGFCLYRMKEIKQLKLDKRYKFMELDTLSLFLKAGKNLFAYVPSAGIHHPFLLDIKMLVKKRLRNLETQFFNQPEQREFTWIDFNSKGDVLKIILWVLYANSILLPLLLGLWRAIKFRNLIAVIEPVVVWITTNLIIVVFLRSKEGRKLLLRSLSNND